MPNPDSIAPGHPAVVSAANPAANPAAASAAASAARCPNCRGEGTVYDQVEWSDGLGGVTCTCSLCDGKGSLDVLAELREYKRRALESGAALAQLQRHVLCYVDTSDPARAGSVRGMPGASPHASTWIAYLRASADATGSRLSTQVRDEQRIDHERGHHAKPTPEWDCPLTNARRYCPLCPPPKKGPAASGDAAVAPVAWSSRRRRPGATRTA